MNIMTWHWSKNGTDTRRKAQSVVRATVKPFDNVAVHFCSTLAGEAIFAARVVKVLARSINYALQAFSSGTAKIALVTYHNIHEARP